MKTKAFNVMFDVTVHDKRALYKAAMAVAMRDEEFCRGMPKAEARELLKPGGSIDVAACVQMLIDPGVSPNGMQIENCTVEAY